MKFMSAEKKWLSVLAGCLTACVLAYPAGATVVIDGTVSAGEYGSPVHHVNPSVSGSGLTDLQSVDLYWAYDNDYVYGAVVGDKSKPVAFTAANIYVYSSGASRNGLGNPGVYGDGDDVIISGVSQWAFSLNGYPWAGPAHDFSLTFDNGAWLGSAGGVWVALNESVLVQEFKISRSLIGNYDKYRFGGQLFAYEFNTGSDDRQPGALVSAPVPEPTTVIAGALLLLPLGVSTIRKFRKDRIA